MAILAGWSCSLYWSGGGGERALRWHNLPAIRGRWCCYVHSCRRACPSSFINTPEALLAKSLCTAKRSFVAREANSTVIDGLLTLILEIIHLLQVVSSASSSCSCSCFLVLVLVFVLCLFTCSCFLFLFLFVFLFLFSFVLVLVLLVLLVLVLVFFFFFF